MSHHPADTPHPLDLYRLAVQHPLAEVGFIERCWAHYQGGGGSDCEADLPEPLLLREDFAGTCAVAAAWCASDPDRQAMAVELDRATAEWAAATFDDPDLHIVVEDVMAVDGPAVDVILALNFSVLIYHDREALVGYLRHALRGLNEGGLLIMDLFGGSSVAERSVHRRRVEPDEGGFAGFDYVWEQRGLDGTSGRIDCRIHFELDGRPRLSDAFVYDWRLWSPGELVESASEAGFADAAVWWAPPGSEGGFKPIEGAPAADDWVAYVVCRAAD